MSDPKNTIFLPTLQYYHHQGEAQESKRMYAVSAALELIKADVSTARERNTSSLGKHMENLASYADLIEDALNKK